MIGPMGKIDYPGLRAEKSRHGKVAYYVRIGDGPRQRVEGTPGTREFHAAYERARAILRGDSVRPERSPKPKAGTVAHAVYLYQRDISWLEQADTTKEARRRHFQKLVESAGAEPLEAITAEVIHAGLQKRAQTQAPAYANKWLKALRAFFEWAVETELVKANPAKRVKVLPNKSDGFTPWSDHDYDLFAARWAIGTAQRLAFELALKAGTRRADLVRLGPGMVRDGVLTYRPGKTSNQSDAVEVSFKIDGTLKEAIEATPRYGLTYLCTAQGRTRSVKGFGGWFREACDAAGIAKGKSVHGIRKRQAERAAERNATTSAIQATFGWKTLQQAERYTRKASRKDLAIETSDLIANPLSEQTKNEPAAPSSKVRRKRG